MPPTTARATTDAERAALLFAQYSGPVLQFARRRWPDLAEDVLSETFVVAVRRITEIPAERELPWLYVVADHVARNLIRKQRRAREAHSELRYLSPIHAAAHETPYVGTALAGLPEGERLMLILTGLEGLSAVEAADRLGVAYGSARNTLMRGRRRLAVRLAAAVALVVGAGLAAAFQANRTSNESPKVIARNLDQRVLRAGAIHDVSDITGSRRSAASRYERWFNTATGASTVTLPSGASLTVRHRDTVQGAASRAGLRLSRQDTSNLQALALATPPGIHSMLASRAVQSTLTPGPRVDGQPTVTFSAVRGGEAGQRYRLQVTMGGRDADQRLLAVKATPLYPRTQGSADTTVVRFVSWQTTEQAAPPSTSQAGPSAAPAPTPIAPPDSDRRPSATAHQAPSAPPSNAAPNTPADPGILHLELIPIEADRGDGSHGYQQTGYFESWVLLRRGTTGQYDTFHVRDGVDGTLGEEWAAGLKHASRRLTFGRNGTTMRASTSDLKYPRHPSMDEGQRILDLLSELEAARSRTDLSPATDDQGRPALSFVSTDGSTRVLLDAATRRPVELIVSEGTAMESRTLMATFETLPGGADASVLRGKLLR